MKQFIGGFFELELAPAHSNGYHGGALALTNARACISYIIQQTRMRKVWLPYYTCDALLEPFQQAGVNYEFYGLNQDLELLELPRLEEDSFIVYVNYFALKTPYVQQLVNHYADRLLVDNTQDFFAKGYSSGWSFNSARKFFGVPDGGYLYGPAGWSAQGENIPKNTRFQVQHLVERLVEHQAEGYAAFVAYEKTLNSEVLRISDFSLSVLTTLDFEASAKRRSANFKLYHQALGHLNTFAVPAAPSSESAIAFSYPFVPAELVDRTQLFKKNIFIPWLWNDALTRIPGDQYPWEKDFTQRLLPLPVDHRYGEAEVEHVIKNLLALL